MGWKVLSTGSCVCVGASSADGCQMSLGFQTSQLASLKGIILTNTQMDGMMIFVAAEETTLCILLVW